MPNTVRGDAVRLQKQKPRLNNIVLDPLVPLKYFNPVISLKINCWLTSEVLNLGSRLYVAQTNKCSDTFGSGRASEVGQI